MQARLLLALAGWSVVAFQSAVARSADDVSPAADAAARAAYQRAEVAYQSKDLASALHEMEQAYQLSQRADLLYNLARIEDELGRCGAAREHYQQYLQRVPEGEARAEAQVADERLAVRCNNTATAALATAAAPAPPVAASVPPTPTPTPTPTSERRSPPISGSDQGSTQRWIGWSLVAGGVVAGIGAAYFLDATIDARDALQASVNSQLAGGPRYDRGLKDEKERHERTARALGAASAALLVGGAIVVLLAPRASETALRAGVQVQPGLFAATYRHPF